ncbi:hypothetical protein PFISCL1PPCAC_10912, partial [Pristionchus fissidentatus]
EWTGVTVKLKDRHGKAREKVNCKVSAFNDYVILSFDDEPSLMIRKSDCSGPPRKYKPPVVGFKFQLKVSQYTTFTGIGLKIRDASQLRAFFDVVGFPWRNELNATRAQSDIVHLPLVKTHPKPATAAAAAVQLPLHNSGNAAAAAARSSTAAWAGSTATTPARPTTAATTVAATPAATVARPPPPPSFRPATPAPQPNRPGHLVLSTLPMKTSVTGLALAASAATAAARSKIATSRSMRDVAVQMTAFGHQHHPINFSGNLLAEKGKLTIIDHKNETVRSLESSDFGVRELLGGAISLWRRAGNASNACNILFRVSPSRVAELRQVFDFAWSGVPPIPTMPSSLIGRCSGGVKRYRLASDTRSATCPRPVKNPMETRVTVLATAPTHATAAAAATKSDDAPEEKTMNGVTMIWIREGNNCETMKPSEVTLIAKKEEVKWIEKREDSYGNNNSGVLRECEYKGWRHAEGGIQVEKVNGVATSSILFEVEDQRLALLYSLFKFAWATIDIDPPKTLNCVVMSAIGENDKGNVRLNSTKVNLIGKKDEVVWTENKAKLIMPMTPLSSLRVANYTLYKHSDGGILLEKVFGRATHSLLFEVENAMRCPLLYQLFGDAWSIAPAAIPAANSTAAAAAPTHPPTGASESSFEKRKEEEGGGKGKFGWMEERLKKMQEKRKAAGAGKGISTPIAKRAATGTVSVQTEPEAPPAKNPCIEGGQSINGDGRSPEDSVLRGVQEYRSMTSAFDSIAARMIRLDEIRREHLMSLINTIVDDTLNTMEE